jgi:hypothetical protein
VEEDQVDVVFHGTIMAQAEAGQVNLLKDGWIFHQLQLAQQFQLQLEQQVLQ